MTARAAAPPLAHVVVVVRADTRSVPTVAHQLVSRTGGSLDAVWSHALRGFAATVPAANVRTLRADPAVLTVEPDVSVRMSATTQPDPPWGLDRLDQRATPLDHAFHYSATGARVRAYVVDTGIRMSHGDFGGRAVTGIDLVDGGAASDCNGHGTHVAGTIGGTTKGVAKRVRLVAVRVLDCSGSARLSRVIAGLDWVAAHHSSGTPAVANLSFGGHASPAVDEAVKGVIADGVTVVVAAGNDGGDACAGSPGRVRTAITVSATDRDDRRPQWADRGKCVDLFAPGVGIRSDWYKSDTATKTLDGTSMAAPHVSGVAARWLQAHQTATPAQVRAAVVRAATRDAVVDAQTPYGRLLYSRW